MKLDKLFITEKDSKPPTPTPTASPTVSVKNVKTRDRGMMTLSTVKKGVEKGVNTCDELVVNMGGPAKAMKKSKNQQLLDTAVEEEYLKTMQSSDHISECPLMVLIYIER